MPFILSSGSLFHYVHPEQQRDVPHRLTMEGLLSVGQKYRKLLSVVLPAGALGLSVLLGSTGAQAAREIAVDPQAGSPLPRVAERLAAIRDAVSEITGAQDQPARLADREKLAWHNWANFSFGLPSWNNFYVPQWNNWGNGWNNWNNNWSNGWNNWSNGWNNWNNGWNNY